MAIDRLAVEKFKSFKDLTEIELRGLTILAGANSSGKSSIMQPLLLLKQTLEAGYDPGPLLISGPNVIFSETAQMLWAAQGEKCSGYFVVKANFSNNGEKTGVEIKFGQDKGGPAPVKILKCAWMRSDGKQITLSEGMPSDEIKALVGLDEQEETVDDPDLRFVLVVERTRAFLTINMKGFSSLYLAFGPDLLRESQVKQALRAIIHVPGLRGNPRRTYPVTAVGKDFPGLFHDYVASIIAHWQRNGDAQVDQLGKDLQKLGLTWKVKARQKSDAEVEILVGRLPAGRQGGARDLVSIADVGFGLSQSLPVAVALLAAAPGQLVYLEQPEIHLHPRAQVALAELIQQAVARGVQVVVETHSELLLLGIQKAIATRLLSASQVALHWFSRDKQGASHVTSAEIDERGTWGDMPLDFADVSMAAMREYLDATVL